MAAKHKRWTHTVPDIQGNIRIDDYCGPIFPMLGSKSATKKAIKAGRLKLNGKTATTANYLHPGDKIELFGSGIRKAKAINIPLEIIYEDDHLVIVNKPGGIAVNGNRYKTVENAMVGKVTRSNLPDALPRPIAVHRIDVPTNGLVVMAKSKSALMKMTQAFQTRSVRKSYRAIVHGSPPNRLTIQSPVDQKEAITLLVKLRTVPSRKYQQLSLVELTPITGRTHQLRIHMQKLDHLIVGDRQYAHGRETVLGKGLMLCASSMSFVHPINGNQVDLTIEVPAKFNRILDREEARYVS